MSHSERRGRSERGKQQHGSDGDDQDVADTSGQRGGGAGRALRNTIGRLTAIALLVGTHVLQLVQQLFGPLRDGVGVAKVVIGTNGAVVIRALVGGAVDTAFAPREAVGGGVEQGQISADGHCARWKARRILATDLAMRAKRLKVVQSATDRRGHFTRQAVVMVHQQQRKVTCTVALGSTGGGIAGLVLQILERRHHGLVGRAVDRKAVLLGHAWAKGLSASGKAQWCENSGHQKNGEASLQARHVSQSDEDGSVRE